MSLGSDSGSADGLSVGARREIRRALTGGRAVSDPALMPAAVRRGEEALTWLDRTQRRLASAGGPGVRSPWFIVLLGVAALAVGAARGTAALLAIGALGTLIGAAAVAARPYLLRRYAALRRRVEASVAANRRNAADG
jgi:hypothetical protein